MSKLPCHHADEDLLMVVHGSAGPAKWLDVRLRVLTCATCRERMAEHARLSSAFAVALRNPSSASPLGAINPWRFRPAGHKAFIVLLLGLLLIAGVTTTVTAFRNHESAAPPEPNHLVPIKKCANEAVSMKTSPTLHDKSATNQSVPNRSDDYHLCGKEAGHLTSAKLSAL